MMSTFYPVILFVTLFILLVSLVERVVKEVFYLSEPFLGLIYGIIIGPKVLNFIDPSYFTSKDVLYYMAKTVLCIQTMAVAMSLPHKYVLNNAKSLFSLVFVIGIMKYFITFLIVYYFTPYNFTASFGIAAALTPTDPIISASIIKSKFADENIPERLRLLLTAESGINDGLGLFLLFIPIDLSLTKNLVDGLSDLVFSTILYKTILAAFIGIIIGNVARKLLHFCSTNNLVGNETFLVYGLTLTFFVLGVSETMQISELVCIFFAGTAFTWDEWYVFETRESKFQEVIDLIFTISFFVFFGSRIEFSRIDYNIVLCALVVICFRRILACVLLHKLLDPIQNKKEAVFIGWFGPIGVGALYYSLYLDRILDTVTFDTVSTVVLTSVVVHGLTIPIIKCIGSKSERIRNKLEEILPGNNIRL